MRILGLVVREKSEFKENVYAVTDGWTDGRTCLSAQTVRTNQDVYAYKI